jgi:hypothetical protein
MRDCRTMNTLEKILFHAKRLLFATYSRILLICINKGLLYLAMFSVCFRSGSIETVFRSIDQESNLLKFNLFRRTHEPGKCIYADDSRRTWSQL